MDKITAINTILSFANLQPYSELITTDKPNDYLIAENCLNEEVNNYNGLFGTSATYDTIPNQYKNYYVYRASRSYVGRTLGFEDNAVQMAMASERTALGMAIKYIISELSNDYNYLRGFVTRELSKATSIEDASYIVEEILLKIDDIEVPTYLDAIEDKTLIQEYKMYIYGTSSESQVFTIEKDKLFKKLALRYLDTLSENYDYYRTVFLHLTKEASSFEEVVEIIKSIIATIDKLEQQYVDYDDKELILYSVMVMNGLELGSVEKAKYLKKLRLSTVAFTIDSQHRQYSDFVLQKLTGETKEEVEDEVNIWNLKLNTVNSIEELMLEYGNDLPNAEKIRLAKTIALNYLNSKENIGYFKNYILSQCVNATTADEVIDIVDSIEDSINEIVSPFVDSESSNRYKLAVLTNDANTIQSLNKQYSLETIGSKLYSDGEYDYRYFANFVLQSLKGNTIDEIDNEIDTIIQNIQAIEVPNDLSDIDKNRYKMNILLIANGEENIDKLISSIVELSIKTNLENKKYKELAKLISEIVDRTTVESISNSILNAINTIEALFENSKKYILSIGWKFNKRTTTLYPDAYGYIYAPKSFLSIESDANDISVVDWKIYNKADETFIWDSEISVKLIEDIVEDRIPFSVMNLIQKQFIFECYMILSSDANKQVMLGKELKEAKVNAISDNASKINGNFLENDSNTTLLDRESI